MASLPHVRGYRLTRRLGTGAMGEVYEAIVRRGRRSLVAGQKVAVKILHAHLATDEIGRRAFKREAGFGMGIRHPNLSRVYELGTCGEGESRRPFLVMAYQQGRSLREVLGPPLPENFIRVVGRQIALALAALHERKIIHRDLKPENIFLDARAHVVVSDYGLSHLMERHESSYAETSFAGSLAYAAPERLRKGARPGAPSDLFSLGVILYEMASGEHPFGADDVPELIENLLHRKFPSLSQRRPSLSYLLEVVIGLLLERNPKNRLKPASLVGRVLDKGEGSTWWRKHIESSLSDVDAGHRALAVDRPTRMYGRDKELELILSDAHEVFIHRRGRVIVVQGETGSGKSRLIDELSDAMEAREYRGFFLVGRPQSAEQPLPFEAVNGLIERALSLRNLPASNREAIIASSARDWLDCTKDEAKSIAAFLMGRESEGWPLERAVRLYVQIFKALTKQFPAVLVFESVHRAGRGSLAVIRALVGLLGELPILLIGTLRDEAVREGGNRDGESLLQEIESLESGRLISLHRLETRDISFILRDLGIAQELVPPLAQRLGRDGGSQPEYVIQVVRMLERDGQLAKALEEGVHVLDVPGNPLDLAYRRLFRLRTVERRFLEASSIQGITFTPEATSAILGLSPMQAVEVQASLESRHGLILLTDRGARFSSHVSWKLIHDAIDPEVRVDYHRRFVHQLLRTTKGPPSGDLAVRITGHSRDAKEWKVFAQAVLAAVEHLISRNLLDEALHWCEEARASEASLPKRLWLRQAHILGRLGRREQQGETLTRALREALKDSPGDRTQIAEIQLAFAVFHLDRSRFLAALRAVDQAETLFRELKLPGGLVESLCTRASLYLQLDDLDEARAAVQEAWSNAENQDSHVVAVVRLELGKLLIATADLDRARGVLENSLEDVTPQSPLEGLVRMHLARACRDLCLYGMAFSHARIASEIAVKIGDRLLEGRSLYLMGGIALRAGHIAPVIRLFDRALAIAEEVDDRYSRVYVLADRGIALSRPSQVQDLESALDSARLAVSGATDLELQREICLVHAALALVYLENGRTKWADSLSAKSMREVSRAHAGWYRTAEVFWIRYRVLVVAGRKSEAESVLEQGRAIVRERIARQSNTEIRSRMTRRDPVHRALLKGNSEL